MYFGALGIVFIYAYGVAVQSLLYPNSDEHVWDILYRIFYRPYLIMLQDFDTDEVAGTIGSLFIDNTFLYPVRIEVQVHVFQMRI